MKITGLLTMGVALPTRRAHKWASSITPIGSGYVLVKVHTDEGIVGLGEAPVLKEWGGDFGQYYGETPTTVTHMINDNLAPILVGEDPFRIEHIHTLMDRCAKGHFYAKAAIDFALYDIVGKALSTPVYELLGGLYRRAVPIAHSLGIMETDKALAEAIQAVEEGIKTIKVKVGLDPERDVQVIRNLRTALGDTIRITVDGNEGYPTPAVAIKTIKRMEEYNIFFAEQPVAGINGLAKVARAVNTPIMADESAWTPYDILRILEKNAARLISIYTTKPGGLFKAKKVAALAEAGGLLCNVNGSAEMGVGNAANLHLAASTKVIELDNLIMVTTPAGMAQTKVAGYFYLDDIVKEPFEYKDGCIIVPDKPGLGVELDEAKVEKYRVA